MKYELLKKFRNEMFDEAKRLVELVYKEDDVFYNDRDKFELELDNKFKDFSICIDLLLIPLCHMKYENMDYMKDKIDIKRYIDHYKRYIPYKEAMGDINMEDITYKIAEDIVKNKYSDKSLFEIIPKLADKYMKCHNDSVDHEAIVMLLEEQLLKFNKKLENCNLNSLVEV